MVLSDPVAPAREETHELHRPHRKSSRHPRAARGVADTADRAPDSKRHYWRHHHDRSDPRPVQPEGCRHRRSPAMNQPTPPQGRRVTDEQHHEEVAAQGVVLPRPGRHRPSPRSDPPHHDNRRQPEPEPVRQRCRHGQGDRTGSKIQPWRAIPRRGSPRTPPGRRSRQQIRGRGPPIAVDFGSRSGRQDPW